MLPFLAALALSVTYCYHDKGGCASRGFILSFTDSDNLISMIKTDPNDVKILVSGKTEPIKMKDLAGLDVTFVQDDNTGKITIDFSDPVAPINSQSINWVTFSGIEVIPVSKSSETILTLNGYAVMFGSKSSLVTNLEVTSNIQKIGGHLGVLKEMKQISKFDSMKILVEADYTFDDTFPIITAQLKADIEIDNFLENLIITLDAKKVSFGTNNKTHMVSFKDTGDLTIVEGNKSSISGTMAAGIVMSLVSNKNCEITLKSGSFNLGSITSTSGALIFEATSINPTSISLTSAILSQSSNQALSIKTSDSYFKGSMTTANGMISVETDTATIEGVVFANSTISLANLKVNKLIKIINPLLQTSTVSITQLELTANTVIQHEYHNLKSTVLSPQTIVLPADRKINFMIYVPVSIGSIDAGTRIPIITSPSITTNIGMLIKSEAKDGFYDFSKAPNTLATYVDKNTLGIEFIGAANAPDQKIQYMCRTSSINSISYSAWQKYDNDFTKTMEFVFCASPDTSQTLEFRDLKHQMNIILTDGSPSRDVSLTVDFSPEMFSKVETFSSTVKVLPKLSKGQANSDENAQKGYKSNKDDSHELTVGGAAGIGVAVTIVVCAIIVIPTVKYLLNKKSDRKNHDNDPTTEL